MVTRQLQVECRTGKVCPPKDRHSTAVPRNQPRRRWFCWCQVLLPTCPCWRQLSDFDWGEDDGVFLSGVNYTCLCAIILIIVTVIITSTASEGDWQLSTSADPTSIWRVPIRPISGFWGAKFPKMRDCLPRTPMNLHVKCDAGKIHIHTNKKHTETNTLPIDICG